MNREGYKAICEKVFVYTCPSTEPLQTSENDCELEAEKESCLRTTQTIHPTSLPIPHAWPSLVPPQTLLQRKRRKGQHIQTNARWSLSAKCAYFNCDWVGHMVRDFKNFNLRLMEMSWGAFRWPWAAETPTSVPSTVTATMTSIVTALLLTTVLRLQLCK